MSKHVLFYAASAFMLTACEVSVDHEADAPAAAAEKASTSPYTNCDFDSAASTESFDTVILNGRVMDPECNFDGIRNVGIRDGRIAMITGGDISGGKTIDATGQAVVPGFINTHTHSFAPFDQKMVAHDGATTLLDTEVGAADANHFWIRKSELQTRIISMPSMTVTHS